MLEVGSRSSHETAAEGAVLPTVGTEADLGAVIVRLARMAAAVHMAQAACVPAASLTTPPPLRQRGRGDTVAPGGGA